ncbi:MAG TPA: polyprenyl synthetase family protein [Ramlibacter sp.]|jgi:geranylgeranyl diphosphate synthase type II|uniref:polyprenyl synthetase family protein n=1 Tax=Ramlibacter sp. TaxID=1917967 RepID=UPI002D63C9BF|nr:polyprenyl synthetase family protein [Ramlibacter sp.]HZY19009.1 polyprenyl synthetase family protein [Ramlibacter sp.]
MPNDRDQPLDSLAHPTAVLRLQIDARLGELLPPEATDSVAQAMRAAALAPGKRLRPLLTLMAGQALGAPLPALLDAGCAVEMVHAASLVMDDLPCMDDADLRRGEPSVHVRFGEDVAMLAAVGLLMQANEVLLQAPGLDASARCQLALLLSRCVGPAGLVRGQFKDLREGAATRTVQAVVEANELKTGVLFRAALQMAAVVAHRPDAHEPLARIAADIGQAFQLRDDLEDGEGLASLAEDDGKSTMVALLGRRGTEQLLQDHVQRALEQLRALLGTGNLLEPVLRGVFVPPAAGARAEPWAVAQATALRPAAQPGRLAL